VHPVVVVLNLKGGTGSELALACGLRHHYTLYARGTAISYEGAVKPAPTGKWKVKVKVKQCGSHGFQEVFSGKVAGRRGGHFSGTIPPRAGGRFFARAYYETVQPPTQSDKEYFHTR